MQGMTDGPKEPRRGHAHWHDKEARERGWARHAAALNEIRNAKVRRELCFGDHHEYFQAGTLWGFEPRGGGLPQRPRCVSWIMRARVLGHRTSVQH